MDLTQRHVALEFVHGERPFYSVAQMHAAVGNEVSDDTVRSRLQELEERGVLQRQRVNNGDVYWLNHDESEWPIPNDVEVEPKREELTVSEWRRKPHVRVAAGSVLLTIIGTAITLVGVFQIGGYYQLPIAASELLTYGLSAGLLSYFGFMLAVVVWIFDIPEITEFSFSNRFN
jgi:hypothetical protein